MTIQRLKFKCKNSGKIHEVNVQIDESGIRFLTDKGDDVMSIEAFSLVAYESNDKNKTVFTENFGLTCHPSVKYGDGHAYVHMS